MDNQTLTPKEWERVLLSMVKYTSATLERDSKTISEKSGISEDRLYDIIDNQNDVTLIEYIKICEAVDLKCFVASNFKPEVMAGLMDLCALELQKNFEHITTKIL